MSRQKIVSIVGLLATLGISACAGPQLLNATASLPRPVQKDVPYADFARARMDVYAPKVIAADTPVLVFIHGGSWQNGSKDDYKFLGSAFAQRGVETVVINYRLHPEAVFPGFMADAAAAIVKVKKDIAGNRPVFISGHSAGAQIASLLALDPQFLAAAGTSPCQVLSGVIGVSGPYHFTPYEPIFKEIFPADRLEAARPINFASNRTPPTLLLHGTSDDVVLVKRSEDMAAALRAGGNEVELKTYPKVGHLMIIGAVSPLVRSAAPTLRDTVDFISAQKQKGYPGCSGGAAPSIAVR